MTIKDNGGRKVYGHDVHLHFKHAARCVVWTRQAVSAELLTSAPIGSLVFGRGLTARGRCL